MIYSLYYDSIIINTILLTYYYREMTDCFPQLHNDPDTRCVIINGAGQAFTAGMAWLL